MTKRLWRACGIVLTLGLVAAGCGDDGESSGPEESADTSSPVETDSEQPIAGGTLTIGQYTYPFGLDPIVMGEAFGQVGGIETAAIYDTIVRWDDEASAYEPRTAESVDASDDFTTWTIKLREGVTFSDGTAYDAEAVKFGIDRHRSGQPGAPACEQIRACPTNTSSTAGPMAIVEDVTVVDPLTVQITLKESWPAFPVLLAGSVGMIPSPTAVKAACPGDQSPIRECSYNNAPVGAGPFVVDNYLPRESLRLKKNPNYYGGDVYLDEVVFRCDCDAGGEKSLISFEQGTTDVAYLQSPPVVAKVLDDGHPNSLLPHQAAMSVTFNLGREVTCSGGQPASACAGKPDGTVARTTPRTADPDVRRAIAHAIDQSVVNERAADGAANPHAAPFGEDFRWYPGEQSYPSYDPAKATEYADKAKANGWDGRVSLQCGNTPELTSVAQSIQALAGAAGITVEVETLDTATSSQKRLAGDFEMSCVGLAIAGSDRAYTTLQRLFESGVPSNYIGYSNPDTDQALENLRLAESDDDKTDAYGDLSESLAEEVPYISLYASSNGPVWSNDVQGIESSVATFVYLDKAWKRP